MKIGIGVITAGLRGIHRNIRAFAPQEAFIHVQIDAPRSGVARARNRCLKRLYDEGCDYLFLFDDDCYPVMPGWAEYFIQQSKLSNLSFFGIPESFKSKPLTLVGEIVWWDSIIGCFNMQTRDAMHVIGYYNSAYDTYGYEDVGRNARVKRSGLCGAFDGYPSPLRSFAYIHSEDVYSEAPAPNLSQSEKMAFISKNEPVFWAELNDKRNFYDSDGKPRP